MRRTLGGRLSELANPRKTLFSLLTTVLNLTLHQFFSLLSIPTCDGDQAGMSITPFLFNLIVEAVLKSVNCI